MLALALTSPETALPDTPTPTATPTPKPTALSMRRWQTAPTLAPAATPRADTPTPPPTATATTIPTPTKAPPEPTPTEPPTRRPTPTVTNTPAAEHSPTPATHVLPWTLDGITADEAITLHWLDELRRADTALEDRLRRMPFLVTHELTDTNAVRALAQIAAQNPAEARQVATLPALDDGITDDDTTAVAVTYGEFMFGNSTETMLGIRQPIVETAHIRLLRRHPAVVTVAYHNSENHPGWASAAITDAVTKIARFAGQPPPLTRHFIVHYGGSIPAVDQGSFAGASISMPELMISTGAAHLVEQALAQHWFPNDDWLSAATTHVLGHIAQPASPPARNRSPRTGTGVRRREDHGQQPAMRPSPGRGHAGTHLQRGRRRELHQRPARTVRGTDEADAPRRLQGPTERLRPRRGNHRSPAGEIRATTVTERAGLPKSGGIQCSNQRSASRRRNARNTPTYSCTASRTATPSPRLTACNNSTARPAATPPSAGCCTDRKGW